MPRGFLVKRAGKSNGGYISYRQRHNSAEEDRQSVNSDSGSEPEHINTQYGSPDSGFSQSPINLTFKPDDSVPDTLRLTDNNKQQVNKLNGATTSDNLMLRDSFKREQLQIKFKLLDNYGFRCTSNSIRQDPNEGVINYSKNKTTSRTITSRDVSHSAATNIDTENNVNIANTKDISTTVSSSSTKGTDTRPSHVANSVYGHSRERDDLRNHNHPLGLLRTLDHRDLIRNQRGALPTSGVITNNASVSGGIYSEQFVNHLKQQQQQFHNGLLAAAAAAKVSAGSSVATSPPLSTGTVSPYSSPLYFSAFDRLTVSSPSGKHHLVQNGDHLTTTSLSTSSGSARSSPAPSSPNKRRASSDCITPSKVKSIKKPKSARKIQFDEDKSSPVSGTIIKQWDEGEQPDNTKKVVCGDIDSTLNIVDATPEARAEIEKIENKIGDYICQLCKEFYDDAFQLASHRCSRIVHIEYRCPECDKVFNCPANLASHRRWHKPRPNGNNAKSTTAHTSSSKTITSEGMVPGMTVLDRRTPSPNNTSGHDGQEPEFVCGECGKKFKRQAYLRKHQANHVNSALQSRTGAPAADLTSAKAKHLLQPQLPSPTAPVMPIEILPREVFDCKYCPSSFNNSPGLTRHINKCHPSENRQVILLQMPVSPRTC